MIALHGGILAAGDKHSQVIISRPVDIKKGESDKCRIPNCLALFFFLIFKFCSTMCKSKSGSKWTLSTLQLLSPKRNEDLNDSRL